LHKDTRRITKAGNPSKPAVKLDELDMQIIALLIGGQNNKEISQTIRVPLSTVQRRTRRIFENNIVRNRVEPDYAHLGLSKGLLHVYVNGKDALQVAGELAKLDGITGVSLHIGNSDVVGEIIYRNSIDVLNAISSAKRIEGVERVVWSEEVMSLPIPNIKAGKLSRYMSAEPGTPDERHL
jgi:DNA-binding Lrp family transcriptional regulator